ncbi:CaiB/BaiF CoA transferase family protein [Cupriavidus oxalaticus]|jgi:crotonobetainyl-CoA:carnitine CoA-transferase CaiB-like acyl-CoA transferase|uniref:CoA transferase n=1 Tax=Cupriavidus oxalaticus TaxID=96344 RepID=A0A375GJR2_9BURK|nr:CaiB/BaiF CoA-transferase family protein [Cupriavidus oxalaticus]QEZ42921.1 CoA transferase [Cupriavidus oxalaticus]QRQ83478.1 CoA transferase [Cupriavidus oxalaticus]QRQ92433.1 CoA transferase [Cupriavidus oxalaticus]WQD87051.1 CaiB/BaiF CoA-transferase family protein [Cupriavidus oxalaticus]SPC07627.1 Alpha-methylacyl-CoA racemase [Cupriavidus oxalaticus]
MHSTDQETRKGPLAGIRIIELAGIGPGPLAGMMLADMGAEVLRIERPGEVDLGVKRERRYDLMLRNRKSLVLDLKDPEAVATVLELLENADALIEGFRPGVTERMGLGPDACMARNPRLVYGRVTGWGQSGPLASAAGHDVNYIALTGALNAIGQRGGPPAIPPAYLGDFAGGGMFLVAGVLAALIEAGKSGKGQVVDAAIVDGAAALGAVFFGLAAAGQWRPERGTNVLDSGAHFYNVYQCKDGGWISVGPIEARFYRDLLTRIGVDPASLGDQNDPASWEAGSTALAEVFRTRTRDEWCALLDGTDACFAPVLNYHEAPHHPHLRARGTFVEVDGIMHPAPAPRFSRTPSVPPSAPRVPDVAGIDRVLAGWLPPDRIDAARAVSEKCQQR